MKRSVTLFGITWLLLLSTIGLTQEWSSPIDLGPGYSPDFDIDPATGTIYLIHHDDGVTYTKVSPAGAIVSQESIPPAKEDSKGRYQFNATIAYDPATKRPHVCYRVEQGFQTWVFDVFYTRQDSAGRWTAPLQLVDDIYRAYNVRMEVDAAGRAHVILGYSDGDGNIFGRATYFRIVRDRIDKRIENLHQYRADDHLEIALGKSDEINIVLSSPDRKEEDPTFGGPVSYYRSLDGGESLQFVGDIHDSNARDRNGNADVYADPSGYVHFAYGSNVDEAVGGQHSVRYARFRDGVKVRDVVVNQRGELKDWAHGLGKGSAAATDDGKTVVMVYNLGDDIELRSRLSKDEGETWSDHVVLAKNSGGSDGREKHVVRAWRNRFFVVYPSEGRIYLREMTVRKPPIAVAGGLVHGDEGATVTFDASASVSTNQEPLAQFRWDWDGDAIFDTTMTSSRVDRVYADDYEGSVFLEVTDSDGLVDTASVLVTIANVPPQVEAGGPYVALINQPIELKGAATDPGVNDSLTYEWDLDGDGIFETRGTTATFSFATPGEQVVRLRVTDDDGGAGNDSALVVIDAGRPVVSTIPNQTVREGEAFAGIDLNNYVADPDHGDEAITWRFSGNQQLQLTLSNGQLTIAVADSEWAGTEKITFVASDPLGNADSTTATFTVVAVNDPPQLSAVPDQTINQGENFSPINFGNFVFDPDDDKTALTVTAHGQLDLVVLITGLAALVSTPDSLWHGSEAITFVVIDTSGAADSTQITFTAVPATGVAAPAQELPLAFALRSNYPNPFNPSTTIPFELSEPAHIQVAVYDIAGRLMATLIDGNMQPGYHQANWRASGMASGSYFIVMRVTRDGRQVYEGRQKLLLLQ